MSKSESPKYLALSVPQCGDPAADRVIERAMLAGMKAAEAMIDRLHSGLDLNQLADGFTSAVSVLLETAARMVGDEAFVEQLVSRDDEFVAGIEELGKNLAASMTLELNASRHSVLCKCPACTQLARN